MSFKKGDYVSLLDDDLTGVVVNISGNSITIQTKDGFEMDFLVSELIKIKEQSEFKHEFKDELSISEIIKQKELSNKQHKKERPRKKRIEPPMEVDLHIHHLIDSTKGMTNYDMLTLQVDTARQQLEFAIKKRIKRVVFIHGVGEGVLKMELETLFRRYNNVEFYDANLQEYGFGATEVYIYQNINP